MIEEFAKIIPSKLLFESGSVFCSGRQAFSRKNGLYILGLNPGSDPPLIPNTRKKRGLAMISLIDEF